MLKASDIQVGNKITKSLTRSGELVTYVGTITKVAYLGTVPEWDMDVVRTSPSTGITTFREGGYSSLDLDKWEVYEDSLLEMETAPLMFPLGFYLGNSIPQDGWKCEVKVFPAIGEKHWVWNVGKHLFAFTNSGRYGTKLSSNSERWKPA